jgi:nucleosome binding factor SPN SPT16 subunit
MVLIHFNLKDAIIIGKKKQQDVQFFTEVIEASINMDGNRRSSYDPDEMEEEQRERETRRRLNSAFKEFAKKVEKVAAHYKFNLEFDIPYSDLGFYGNHSKEMVFIQPSVKCLVNLSEQPFLMIDLNDVDHVHFERVTYATKGIDMAIIFKDYTLPVKQITSIEMKFYEIIQDWLTDISITFTAGPQSMNWNEIMGSPEIGPKNPNFHDSVDADGNEKPAGWSWLSIEDEEGEDEDDDDGDADEYQASSSEDSESASDSDDDESFDDEDSSDDDGEEEDSEEEGKTWDELERDALASDRVKRTYEQDDTPLKKKKQRR